MMPPLDKEIAEALMQAIFAENLTAFVKEHPETAPYLLERDVAGWTPLGWLARQGRLEEAAEILKPLGKIITLDHLSLKDAFGSTPVLSQAAASGHLDQAVEVLKASGQKLTLWHLTFGVTSNNGDTPLHAAAIHGHIDQVAEIAQAAGECLTLGHFFDNNFLRQDILSNWTPFHGAAANGHLDQMAEALKPAGESPSFDDFLRKLKDALPPFHLAAVNGHLDQVAAMLAPSGWALNLDHLLLAHQKGQTLLHMAALGGHLDQVEALLKPSGLRIPVDYFLVEDRRRQTVLKTAMETGKLPEFFSPTIWAGRVGEMQKLWDLVPEEARGKVDYDRAVHEAIRQSLPPAPKWDAKDYAAAASSTLIDPPTSVPDQERSRI